MSLRIKILKIIEKPQVIFNYLNNQNLALSRYVHLSRDLYKNYNTVIDVGANKGELSKISSKYFPKAILYSFEPIPKIFKGPGRFFEIALSDKVSESSFYICLDNNEKSSFSESDSVKNKKEIKVKSIRFDSLNLEIKRPCLLKVDTEGHEYNVLKGFGDKLKEVDVIILEYLHKNFYNNQSKLSDIIKLLESYGFTAFRQLDYNDVVTNLMFYRSDNH